ncbi:MAG: hypothetical protein Kow0069_19280 [Promethearchaeota archaeon]
MSLKWILERVGRLLNAPQVAPRPVNAKFVDLTTGNRLLSIDRTFVFLPPPPHDLRSFSSVPLSRLPAWIAFATRSRGDAPGTFLGCLLSRHPCDLELRKARDLARERDASLAVFQERGRWFGKAGGPRSMVCFTKLGSGPGGKVEEDGVDFAFEKLQPVSVGYGEWLARLCSLS